MNKAMRAKLEWRVPRPFPSTGLAPVVMDSRETLDIQNHDLIPAKAGLFTWDYLCPFVPIHGVIPAKAGIQAPVREIPAFAGMAQ